MSEPVVLERIPFRVNRDRMSERLRVKRGSRHFQELEKLAGEAERIVRPKAMYRMLYIENRGDDWVQVDSVRLQSRVLSVNLQKAYRVFLYVATCGAEAERWAGSKDDLLQRFWAESIKEAALFRAVRELDRHIEESHRPGKVSRMSPGSIEDWPLDQQRALFGLLGDTTEAIGVKLTESLLMIPTKSISGLMFPAQFHFESCQLCPRENCPGRRAPYEADLFERRYSRK